MLYPTDFDSYSYIKLSFVKSDDLNTVNFV